MYYFLILIITGFSSHLASAFTTTYSKRFGGKTGTLISFLFRNVLGIPVWAFGYYLSVKSSDVFLYNSSLLSQIFGWLIITLGGIIIIAALISIQTKSAVATEHDSLVHSGIYAIVRHPIYCGTFLEFIGVLVFYPSYTVGLAFLTGSAWILIQARFEETDLIKRIPGYKDYMSKVPRFFPILSQHF